MAPCAAANRRRPSARADLLHGDCRRRGARLGGWGTEREPLPVPLRLDLDRDSRRPGLDRRARCLRAGRDRAALPTACGSRFGRGRRARRRPPGLCAERAHRRSGCGDDRALDAHRRDPADRGAHGATGDRRVAHRLEHALHDPARHGNRARLGAGGDHGRVLRRSPAGRNDRPRRRCDRARS